MLLALATAASSPPCFIGITLALAAVWGSAYTCSLIPQWHWAHAPIVVTSVIVGTFGLMLFIAGLVS